MDITYVEISCVVTRKSRTEIKLKRSKILPLGNHQMLLLTYRIYTYHTDLKVQTIKEGSQIIL